MIDALIIKVAETLSTYVKSSTLLKYSLVAMWGSAAAVYFEVVGVWLLVASILVGVTIFMVLEFLYAKGAEQAFEESSSETENVP